MSAVTPQKIETFRNKVVAPAFAEIKDTLDRRAMRVRVLDGRSVGDKFLDDMLGLMHGKTADAETINATSPPGQFAGPSLIVEDPTLQHNRFAGRFFFSIELTLGSNDTVYAAPVAFYYMKFNDKFHRFNHRFDPKVERMVIELVTTYHVQNAFLNAFDYFRLYAGRSLPPPQM